MNKGQSLILDMFSVEAHLLIFLCFLKMLTPEKCVTAASECVRVLGLP